MTCDATWQGRETTDCAVLAVDEDVKVTTRTKNGLLRSELGVGCPPTRTWFFAFFRSLSAALHLHTVLTSSSKEPSKAPRTTRLYSNPSCKVYGCNLPYRKISPCPSPLHSNLCGGWSINPVWLVDFLLLAHHLTLVFLW